MYVGYNKSVTPLERFISLGQFAVSRTVNGALVVNFPGDYVVWTEPMAQMGSTAGNQLVSEIPGTKEKQLWLTGSLSPAGKKGNREPRLADSRSHRGAADELRSSLPDYKRPEERVAAGAGNVEY